MRRGGAINYFLDHNDLDKETAEEYLRKAGINTGGSKKNFIKLVNQKRAELKMEKGKKLKEKYSEALKNIENILPGLEKDEPELALAYRKLEEGNIEDFEDLSDDFDKLRLLEYLKIKSKK